MSVRIAVFITGPDPRRLFYTPAVRKALAEVGEVTDCADDPSALENADIIYSGWGTPKLEGALLDSAKKLRLLAHTGGSVVPIVSPELYERGIKVVSANSVFADTVAEGAVTLMLAGSRRLQFFDRLVKNGGWSGHTHDAFGLRGSTVALAGFGMIAKKTAQLLQPFKCKLVAYDPFVPDAVFAEYGVTRAASLAELFDSADIVSLHLPRTAETFHVIDREMLARLRDGAVLVNTARGSVVDEQALADELASGRIYAALDVFEAEPPPSDSKLLGCDNALLQPHVAASTTETWERTSAELIADMKRFLAGEPLQNEISFEYALGMTNDLLVLK